MVADSVDRIREKTQPSIMDNLRHEFILSKYLEYIDKPYREEIKTLDAFLNNHPTDAD
jgi:hypothetical protein